jgi:hypothetical protein
MLRRFCLAVLIGLGASGLARASANPYGSFEQLADAGSLKPFARDLGGILGSATFHSGRILGFSGFDIGGHGGMQFSPDRGDRILRGNGVRNFGLPWIQAEVGMPLRLDGFIRGASYEGLTIAGGGLRYALLKPRDEPWSPQLLLAGSAHVLVHDSFSATHQGLNLVGSMGVTKFMPYVGAGFDHVRLVVRASAIDPTLNGHVVTTFESRFTAGVQVRPWQFFYLHAAYVLAHGRNAGEAGLGLRL